MKITFSLRSTFIITTIMGILFSVSAIVLRHKTQKCRDIAILEQSGFTLRYRESVYDASGRLVRRSSTPTWIVRSLGCDPFAYPTYLKVPSHEPISDESWMIVDQLTTLEAVDISGHQRINDADVLHFIHNKGLESFEGQGTSITGEGFKNFTARKLRSLILAESPIDSQGVEVIANAFPELEILWLDGAKIDEFSAKAVANLTGLKELSVQNVKLDEKSITQFNRLKNLEKLCISYGECEKVELNDLPLLRRVSCGNIPDGNSIAFRNLPALDELPVSIVASELHLAGLPKVRRLELLWCNSLTIEDVPSIEEATFGGCRGDVLRQLRNCAQLKSIEIRGGEDVTDESLRYLADKTQLERIAMSDVPISNQGLTYLAKLPNVREFSLISNHNITDSALDTLRTMPKLERINVHFTKVSLGAIRRLQRDRPDLKIESDYDEVREK